MDEDWVMFLFLGAVAVGILVGGFFIGMHVERKDWKQKLPSAMELLCQECRDLK